MILKVLTELTIAVMLTFSSVQMMVLAKQSVEQREREFEKEIEDQFLGKTFKYQ